MDAVPTIPTHLGVPPSWFPPALPPPWAHRTELPLPSLGLLAPVLATLQPLHLVFWIPSTSPLSSPLNVTFPLTFPGLPASAPLRKSIYFPDPLWPIILKPIPQTLPPQPPWPRKPSPEGLEAAQWPRAADGGGETCLQGAGSHL